MMFWVLAFIIGALAAAYIGWPLLQGRAALRNYGLALIVLVPLAALGLYGLVFVVPSGGDEGLRQAFRTAAETWSRGLAGRAQIVAEDELEALPADRSVWVLGSENRWREPVVAALRTFGAAADAEMVRFGAESVPRADHCFVLTAAAVTTSTIVTPLRTLDRFLVNIVYPPTYNSE